MIEVRDLVSFIGDFLANAVLTVTWQLVLQIIRGSLHCCAVRLCSSLPCSPPPSSKIFLSL